MESLDCDVLVVGGRIAGSILATVLGAAGHEVVVVDRARFPSPTVSTHFFRGAGGVAGLRHVGVLDDVLALGAPKLVCQYDHIEGAQGPLLNPAQDPGEVGFVCRFAESRWTTFSCAAPHASQPSACCKGSGSRS